MPVSAAVDDLWPVHLRLPMPEGSGSPGVDVFIVAVSAGDEVACGEALVADAEGFADAIDALSDCAVGAPPLDRVAIFERMNEALTTVDAHSVLSAIDVTLWDLAARGLGIPLHRLLGGPYYRLLDCYCVARAASDHAKTLQRARDLLSAGYSAISIELSGVVADDCDLIALARKTLGGNARLIFDAKERYDSLDAALEVGAAVDRAEAFWFARPMPEGRWADYARLREPLATPLAAGSRIPDSRTADAALRARAVDILMLDLRLCGGVTGAMRIAEVARLHDARVSFVPLPSGLTTAAAAHCALCTPASVLFPSTAGIPGVWKEMLERPLSFAGGFLHPSDLPGLGVDLADEFVTAYSVEDDA
jgi:D-galactarolactone cycloisomerase